MAKRNKRQGPNREVSFDDCTQAIHLIDQQLFSRLLHLAKEENYGATKIPIDLAVARMEIISHYLNSLNRVVDSDDGREERIILARKKVGELRKDYKSRVEIIRTERLALKQGFPRHHNKKAAPNNGYARGGSSGSGRVFMTGGRTNPRGKN